MELSKISGTLEKGRFYSGGLLKFLYFSTIMCASVIPLAVAAGIPKHTLLWKSIKI